MKTILFLLGLGIGISIGIIAGFHLCAPPLVAIIDRQIEQVNKENDAFRAVIFDKEGKMGAERAKKGRGK